jgi:hypothetical protein
MLIVPFGFEMELIVLLRTENISKILNAHGAAY